MAKQSNTLFPKTVKVARGTARAARRAAGIKAQAGSNQVERVGTAMREAMLNIQVAQASYGKELHNGHRAIVDHILTAAKRNAGNNVVGRGWTANLSPRTVRALTEQGVFA